jgi:hypothetical protein
MFLAMCPNLPSTPTLSLSLGIPTNKFVQVSPENDPRDLTEHHTSASTSPEVPGGRYDGDSDPDEADIEEHIRGQHGFVHTRSTLFGPGRSHHNPAVDPVLNRFIDMLNDLGAPNTHDPAQPPGQPTSGEQDEPPSQQRQQATWGQSHVHRTTFSGGPFGSGTASFTIFSGPIRTQGGGPTTQSRSGDPFQQ